jgi:UDP-glucose 4-epimerase
LAYDWSVVAFRYFNACGSIKGHGERHDPETHIIPLLLQTAMGGRPFFEIFGDDYPTPDGTCLRDYVHVLDIAEAHVAALKRFDTPGFRAFNLGTGHSHSVKEVCRIVEQATGKRLPLRVGPRRLGDPAVLCASPEAISAELGWKAVHSDLEKIVESAWEWEQACYKPSSTHSRSAAFVQQR